MAVLYGISMLAALPSTSHADDITINGGSSANAGGAATSGAVLVGAGNSGTLNVHAGDSLTLNTTDGSTASRIELGNGGTGTMNIDGGTVTVNIANGASAGTSIGRIWVGGGASGTAGGSGTLNLSSGTLQFLPTVADTANYGAIAVGRGNGVTGDFKQSGGVTRFASAGAMDIGTEGGTGTYALSGNAVFDAGDGGMTMYVGSRTSGGAGAGTASQGTVHVSDNAQFTLTTGSNSGGQLFVGDAGATGRIVQDGAGSVVTIGLANPVQFGANVGGLGGTDGGNGSYDLSAGTFNVNKVASSSELVFGAASGGSGTFNLSGGTANIGTDIVLGSVAGSTGTIQQTGGTLSLADGSRIRFGDGTASYALSGGTLKAGGTDAIVGNGELDLGNATLQVQESDFTTSVAATLQGGANFTVDTAGLGATWSGVLSGSGSLTKAGDGTLLLDAANAYSGTTTIAGGTLALSSTGTLGTGGLVDHGIFDMRAVSTGVNLASLSGDGQVMVGTKALVVGGDNSDSSFSGTIVNEGNGWDASYGTFTKVGTGTLTIDGATIQGGETYIAGGAMAQTSGDTHVSYLSVGTSTTNGTPNVGALNISGGTLTLGTGLQVGDWGGTGTVTQTGGDVVINAGCGDSAHCATLNIGNQGGHGTYAISGGSLSFDSGFFDIGRNSSGNPASDGLLAIGGTGAVNVTNGSMVIGNWLGMSAGDVAGTGTVEQTGGTLSIDGNSTLYLSGSGNGTYNLDGGVLRIGGSSLQGNYNNFGGSHALNLGGGTIQVAGSALSTNVSATLKDGTVSTIDTGGLGATWSGVLSGAGALRKAGDGVLTLNAVNTYAGGTAVAGGTLNVANAGALGSGAVSLQAGSTLDFADSYVIANAVNLSGDPTIHVADGLTETFDGAITDGTASGDMVKTGTGNLVLSAANAYTGETVISEGTLSLVGHGTLAASSRVNDNAMLDLSGAAAGVSLVSLAGSGTVNLGARSLSLTNAADTFSGTIQGSGGLDVSGGHQVLAGVNTYTGDTTVSAGELEVTGSIDQSTVRVQGGVLSGNGSVGGLVTSAGATLAPGGQDIGTLTVNGNLSQAAGSTYTAQIGAATSDRVVVNGTATIGEGAVLAIQRLPGAIFTPGTRYEVLSASGGIDGSFTVTGGAVSAFYSIRPTYASNQVFLDTSQDRAFADAADTRNQARTAVALDGLALGDGLRAAVGNVATDAEARKAFDGLSGEIHAVAKTVLMNESEYVRAASTDRLRQAFCAPGGNDASSTHASAVAGDACQPDQTVVWERAFGAWGHTDGSANEARLNQSTNGVLIGADTSLSDAWRVGALGGYDQSTFRLDTRGSNGTSDNYSLGAYAGAQWGQLGLRLGTSYTWHDVETDRSVDFAGYSDRLHAKYNAGTAQVSGELGYAMQAGVVHFEPFAGAAYVALHTDAADEQGGAAALSGRADTMRTAFSTLGLHASSSMALGSVDLTANGSLGWRRAFGTIAQDATQAFAGSQAFDVGSVPVARNAAVLDAGITAQLQKDLSIGVSYTGQFGSGSREQGVRGNLTWSF
jgi:outer membrane autotransporter protein